MALALAGLLAQVHHISAYGFRGDGHLCEVLLVVAEVHREKHLGTRENTVVMGVPRTGAVLLLVCPRFPSPVSVKCKYSTEQSG